MLLEKDTGIKSLPHTLAWEFSKFSKSIAEITSERIRIFKSTTVKRNSLKTYNNTGTLKNFL